MIPLERRMPGQPVIALALVLAGWVGVRAFAWEHALQAEEVGRETAYASRLAASSVREASTAPSHRAAAAIPARGDMWHAPLLVPEAPTAPLASPAMLAADPAMALPADASASAPTLAPAVPSPDMASPMPAARSLPPGRLAGAAGHQAMWLAATALLPLPPLGLRQATVSGEAGKAPPVTAPRWSGDGWLLLRANPALPIVPGRTPGTYGASQAGAVIRYRLDTTSPFKPTVYLRGALAIGKTREQEAALGLSARPIPAVPLALMAEGRVSRSGRARSVVRPVVAVVTELPPQNLGFGFTGEVYAQAGWIGGRRPGGFIDGLARAERPVGVLGDAVALHAGVGAWGATQRGTNQQLPIARVDIGPVASLRLKISDSASARLEADWRFRVKGSARPGSGPVLTLSAGF